MNAERALSATRSIVLAVSLTVAAGVARAEQWIVAGRVVGVTDGDTIKVLDAGKAQHVVRLGGIDAPERKQPFGSVAKEALSSMVFDRRVEARCWKRDRYGREVCGVFVGTRDVGLEMIRYWPRGMLGPLTGVCGRSPRPSRRGNGERRREGRDLVAGATGGAGLLPPGIGVAGRRLVLRPVQYLTPPLLDRSRGVIARALEASQEKRAVPDARQDRLIEIREDRLAERIPGGHQLRYEVARIGEAEVVGAEVALERGAVTDLSPGQAPSAATQGVHAAAHDASGRGDMEGYTVYPY